MIELADFSLLHKEDVLVQVLDDSNEQVTEGGIILPNPDAIDQQVAPPKQGRVLQVYEEESQLKIGDIVVFDKHEGEPVELAGIEGKILQCRILQEKKLYAKLKDVSPVGEKRVALNKDMLLPLNDFVLIQRRKRNMQSGLIIRADDKIYNKIVDIVAVGSKCGDLKGGETSILVQYDSIQLDSLADAMLAVVMEKLITCTISSETAEDMI